MSRLMLIAACWLIGCVAPGGVAFGAVTAVTSDDRPLSIPRGAIGSWVFLPGEAWASEPTSAAMFSLRAALNAGLIRDDGARLAGKILLGLDAVGRHPHRAFVYSFAASPLDIDGGMRLDLLECVIEVRTSRSHLGLIGVLQAALAPPAGERAVQRPEQIGGVDVVSFTRSDLPDWAVATWASEPGVFTVAFGRGVMTRWLRERRGVDAGSGWAGPPSELRGLRGAVSGGEPAVFEAWASVNALRAGFPEAFDESRAKRIFRELGILNARSIGLVAQPRDVGRRDLRLTWAVSDRADAPGSFETRVLTAERGLMDARGGVEGRYRLGFPSALIELEALGSRVFAASLKPQSRFGQSIRRRRWLETYGSSLATLESSIEPVLSVVDDPTLPLRFPGLGVAVAPIRGGFDPALVERACDAMLGGFAPTLRKDAETGFWSIVPLGPEMDRSGVLRFGAVGVVETPSGAAVVAGWSRDAAARTARAVLDGRP